MTFTLVKNLRWSPLALITMNHSQTRFPNITSLKLHCLIGFYVFVPNISFAQCEPQAQALIASLKIGNSDTYWRSESENVNKTRENSIKFAKNNTRWSSQDKTNLENQIRQNTEAITRQKIGLSKMNRRDNEPAYLGETSNIFRRELFLCLDQMKLDFMIATTTSTASTEQRTSTSPNENFNSEGASGMVAKQVAQQSQQLAQQNQARADQQRKGKRKTHDPAAEAHECISIDKSGSGNFGAFKNQCSYPVNFTTCNEKPRVIQGGFNWSADFDCAKQQYGLHTLKGNSSVAAHNRNTEYVYWFACKAPAMPADTEYMAGKGLMGRCY